MLTYVCPVSNKQRNVSVSWQEETDYRTLINKVYKTGLKNIEDIPPDQVRDSKNQPSFTFIRSLYEKILQNFSSVSDISLIN